jgi:hypothetical protein
LTTRTIFEGAPNCPLLFSPEKLMIPSILEGLERQKESLYMHAWDGDGSWVERRESSSFHIPAPRWYFPDPRYVYSYDVCIQPPKMRSGLSKHVSPSPLPLSCSRAPMHLSGTEEKKVVEGLWALGFYNVINIKALTTTTYYGMVLLLLLSSLIMPSLSFVF